MTGMANGDWSLAWLQAGWVEPLAAILVLVNVWLVARRSMWNYAFGIAAVSLYFFVFVETRLYAAAGLQILFLLLNLYGLANWKAARRPTGELPIERMSDAQLLASGAAIVAMLAAIGWLLVRTTDAVMPWWDSGNTALALAAQYWQARRKLECWPLWVLVNMGSIGLYATQSLWFTTATYVVLLFVALWGWRQWGQAAAKGAA